MVKLTKSIFFLVIYISVSVTVFSQSGIDSSSVKSDSISILQKLNKIDSTKEEKDIIDVLRKEFKLKNINHKDIALKIEPGPYLSILPAVGYAIASGYIGALFSNVSFYTGNRENKISSFSIGLFYSQFNQYWSVINSNIYSKNEKFNFVGDWRVYKFPTKTYDLGSGSLPSSADKIDYSYIKIYQLVFERVMPDLYLGSGYHLDYHTNIREVNVDSVVTDFQKYGLNKKSISSGISLNFLYDTRVNSINPSGGTYCSLQLAHNFTFLGSDKNWKSIIFDAREYLKFPGRSRNVLAFWSYNYFTFGKPPYLDLPSVGWDAYNNTGRGYAQGRFRGKNMVYFESEYRFVLSRNGLFGAVVFANAEIFSSWPSNDLDIVAPGYGFGARIKINKKSRANLAIDYGFGNHGSKGVSFNLGELF